MREQSRALKLADELVAIFGHTEIDERVAKELRRLDSINLLLISAVEFICRGMREGHIKADKYLDFSDSNAQNLEIKHPLHLLEATLAAVREKLNEH